MLTLAPVKVPGERLAGGDFVSYVDGVLIRHLLRARRRRRGRRGRRGCRIVAIRGGHFVVGGPISVLRRLLGAALALLARAHLPVIARGVARGEALVLWNELHCTGRDGRRRPGRLAAPASTLAERKHPVERAVPSFHVLRARITRAGPLLILARGPKRRGRIHVASIAGTRAPPRHALVIALPPHLPPPARRQRVVLRRETGQHDVAKRR